MKSLSNVRRAEVVIPLLWLAATAGALLVTLSSLAQDDFDGLNNIFQLPLAFPWVLLPIGTSNHHLNAWIDAGLGVVNAVLLHFWLRRRRIE
ncbi:MAG: hypothetical protein M5U14_01450 [Acidimicrobiia bacterium]|nr:hypothetical protein [Acidimicrobiia bacterium]